MLENLADPRGVVLRRDVIALGLNDNWLARMVRAKELVRVRQGAYALHQRWTDAAKVERHLMLASAVLRQYDDRPVAASHVTACVMQGGPAWGLDLSRVHLTSLHGISERNQAKVVHHRGVCLVGDVTRRDGHWMTTAARTALDTACLAGREAGVCVLDWYLHEGLTTWSELVTTFHAMKEWPDTLGLYRTLHLSDGRSESVGETLLRLLIRDLGLPTPELQWEVFYPNGRVAGRVDMAWPEYGLLLEFDGRAKYAQHRRPGESVADAVLREKEREDLLRELTGFRMIRITWQDLERPEETAHRLRQALARGAR
ncbi:type IV toxin-antitoxin system AbiEi family antitoxin domain-containing protein [Nocardioides lijunqiniae]|uniref:type IV toxin-antitoxin system AbiEi family antitoxin domain-containing protein n=1 Tax=Nocardioides lijunqiniae TaxID=2760832 RepID=UPI0018779E39|nr:type IV toxin-antitoxin system AbiEi family antitoxin domain-containing protein [Nocardioides lijunqiniae]